MSIFKEMHETRGFGSYQEFRELQRMLTEAIDRRHVEEVPVMKRHPMDLVVNWYRDKETGEIYCLIPPDFPAQGWWDRVGIEDLVRSNHAVQ